MMDSFKPGGWPTLVPRLFTTDVAGLVDFLKVAFDAEGEAAAGRPSELRIGDSLLLISDGGGVRSIAPGFFYLYVQDADETYRRALEAGAETIEAPANMPYGDRRAMVCDRWGNRWQIATFRG